jgi:hypothetical protein
LARNTITDEQKADVLDEVRKDLIGTNRVNTLDGVIPWLKDWADNLRLKP